jgi:hypothetical protein
VADRLNVELARVGEYDLSTGRQKFTAGMLTDAATRAAADGWKAPIKLGHTDPRNDGEPAFGWLTNVRAEGTGNDTRLIADITDMPRWLDESADWAYPHRSIEADVLHASADPKSEPVGMDLTALALLGVTPPGMPNIASWRDLPKVLVAAAAASGSDLTVGEFRTAFEVLHPTDPGMPAGDPNTTPEGVDSMSDFMTKVRETLGVAADLDEAGTLSALGEALAEKADPAPPTTDAIAAAYGIPADQVETRLKNEPTVTDGKMLVDKDQWDDVVKNAGLGAKVAAKLAVKDRDEAIDTAWRTGRISASAKDTWTKRWDKDAATAATDLADLPVVFPVAAAAGYAGQDGSGGESVAAFTDNEAAQMASLTGTSKEAYLS